MSRFFRSTGSSDSDSDSSSDGSDAPAPVRAPPPPVSRFARLGESSGSDSDERPRVVKSVRDRRYDALRGTVKALRNHLKIGDWNSITSDYDQLFKQLAKVQSFIEKDGYPKFFVKALVDLEDGMKAAAAAKESQRLSATNSKALNSMKQKVKKTIKPFEAEMAKCREHPDQYAEPLDDSGGEASESDDASAAAAPAPAPAAPAARGAAAKSAAASAAATPARAAPASRFMRRGSDSSESSSAEEKPAARPAARPTAGGAGLDWADSDSFGAQSEESSTSSSESVDQQQWEDVAARRRRWLLKPGADEKPKPAAATAPKPKPAAPVSIDTAAADAAAAASASAAAAAGAASGAAGAAVADGAATATGAAAAGAAATPPKEKEIEWTDELVRKKLAEAVAQRGRKGADRVQLGDLLKLLLSKAVAPLLRIEVVVQMTALQLDATPALASCMPSALWRTCHDLVSDTLAMLDQNPEIVKDLLASNAALIGTDDESIGQRVISNLLAFLGRLHDELIKAWQFTEANTQDYILRLQDELFLIALAERMRALFLRVNASAYAAVVALRTLEHLYYKRTMPALPESLHATPAAVKLEEGAAPDAGSAAAGTAAPAGDAGAAGAAADGPASGAAAAAAPVTAPAAAAAAAAPVAPAAAAPAAAAAAAATPAAPEILPPKMSSADGAAALTARVQELCALVHAYGDERVRVQAYLCEIFHHALHDRFYQARDLLLMSHLQEVIHQYDVPIMIQFNRTMIMLGLCAFRAGLIPEAHQCLTEICSLNKTRELLGQGLSMLRFQQERTPEQEKIEKRRLVPPHMHISLDLIEFVHLVTAMLLEVPNMAADTFDLRRRVISRPLRKWLDHYQRQPFVGPPENTRDHVIAATRALARGDWAQCVELIMKLPAWRMVPNDEAVRVMLRRKIQEEGLRTYLFAYSTFYDSFSLSKLSEMFDLQPNTVHAIVSKMMINEELHAMWDQPTSAIVMRKTEPQRLQSLALQCAEKLNTFVDTNERLVDYRTGGVYKKDDRKEGGAGGVGGTADARPGDRYGYGGERRRAQYSRQASSAALPGVRERRPYTGRQGPGRRGPGAGADYQR